MYVRSIFPAPSTNQTTLVLSLCHSQINLIRSFLDSIQIGSCSYYNHLHLLLRLLHGPHALSHLFFGLLAGSLVPYINAKSDTAVFL